MGTSDHYVHQPEWVIEQSGLGSFRSRCTCGWVSGPFDLPFSAKEAGREHASQALTAARS